MAAGREARMTLSEAEAKRFEQDRLLSAEFRVGRPAARPASSGPVRVVE